MEPVWVIKRIKNHWMIRTNMSNSALVPFHKHNNILSGHINKICLLCKEKIPDYILFQLKVCGKDAWLNKYTCIMLDNGEKELQIYKNNGDINIPYYSVTRGTNELFGFSQMDYSKLQPALEEYRSKNKKSLITNFDFGNIA